MPRLGVNIDHVATLRQARGGREPDPVWAAVLAELGGADGITVHLREDRRHIQDRDVRLLRQTTQVRLNLELAVEPEIVALALELKPEQLTFVPERRAELTTEGGLDVVSHRDRVSEALARCRDSGLEVALFIDPDPKQVEVAAELGADAVELHTGRYADASDATGRIRELSARDRGHRRRGRGNGTPRRAWPQLPKCGGNRPIEPYGGAEHRAQHREPGRLCRTLTSRTRDERMHQSNSCRSYLKSGMIVSIRDGFLSLVMHVGLDPQ